MSDDDDSIVVSVDNLIGSTLDERLETVAGYLRMVHLHTKIDKGAGAFWALQTTLVSLLSEALVFCKDRKSDAATSVLHNATSLIVQLSHDEDDSGYICSKLCSPGDRLLEAMGECLLDTKQSFHVSEMIVYTLANICAESNHSLKQQVIERACLVDYFDRMTNNLDQRMAVILPWALQNLFVAGMAFFLDSEEVVPSCIKLSATCLNHIL